MRVSVDAFRFLKMGFSDNASELDAEEREGEDATDRLESSVVTRQSAMVNFHMRDSAIRFEAGDHVYKLHPGSEMEAKFPISVSGLWGKYFEEFDAEAIIRRYFKVWAESPHKDYFSVIQEYREKGESDEEIAERIRAGWMENGAIASAQGTRMHRNIELALGGELYDGDGPEMQLFQRFVKDWLEPRGWRVYRLEWSIYCSTAMVAGQIDAVFICNGQFHMIDWKRCRKLLDEDAGGKYGHFGRAPFGHLLDNPCNHYFVQQNVYAVILRRYYGVDLSSMWLCHIHPSYDSYHLIEVPDLRQQADMILDEYALGRTE